MELKDPLKIISDYCGTDSNNNNAINEKHFGESIHIANELCERLFKTNSLPKNIDPDNRNLYLAKVKAIKCFIEALATMDPADIGKAHKRVDDLDTICQKYRKTSFIASVLSYVKTPNYQRFTDVEAHAELLYTFCLLLSAMVCAMETNSIIGLIKIAFRLQKAAKILRGCKVLRKMKTKWESDLSKDTFEAGYLLGSGLSHVIISHMPPKLLRIVNMIGIRGVHQIGMSNINRSAFLYKGIDSHMAKLALVIFGTYLDTHLGLEPMNLDNVKQIIENEMKVYPNFVMYLALNAKLSQITGKIGESIGLLNNAMTDNNFDKANKWFHFELMFSHALTCNWSECIKYAELIRKGSRHSPAYTTYCEAVFRYVKGVATADTGEVEKAIHLLQLVPAVRVRYFGKSVSLEKSAVMRAQKFADSHECSLLPDMDLLYQWNMLSFIRNNTELLNKFMDRVVIQINKHSVDIKTSDHLDNYLTALFYKGVIHRLLSEYNEAKECLKTVFEDEARISNEFSIPPQAVLELGLVELELNNGRAAETWLKKCTQDYSNYTNENFVHLRAYAALRALGLSTDKQTARQSIHNEYKNQWLEKMRAEGQDVESTLISESQFNN